MVGQSWVVRYSSPLLGFDATVPQSDPPRAPGSDRLSERPGGVNIPSLRICFIRAFQRARSSAVRMYGLISSLVIRCRANGGGAVGNGCVGHACSPGISLFGVTRSSIGHNGLLDTRSNTNKKPCFVDCATASTV